MRCLALLSLLAVAASAAAQTPLGGPAGHRLLLAPTARAVPAGDARVGVTEVVIPTAAAGLGGGVSLGLGVLALPDRNVLGVLFAEPKWTVVDRDAVAVAIGVTTQARLLYRPQATALPFAVVTVGRGRTVGTLGLGARVNVSETPTLVLFDDLPFGDPPVTPGDLATPDRYKTYLVAAPVAWAGLEAQASGRVTVVVEAAALPSQNLTFDFAPDCCAPSRGYPVVRGDVYYDVTLGAAARVQAGPAAFDLGLILGRDGDGFADSVMAVVPWLSATVGL